MLRISHYSLTSALGRGKAAHLEALRSGTSGLRRQPFETCALPCWIGTVDGLDQPLAGDYANWDCRNNRLAALALDGNGFRAAALAARARYGADRVGVFIGTSTSGVHQTELAYRMCDRTTDLLPGWFDYRRTQNTYSVADFVRLQLGLSGLSIAISTACSSSAKVFASAHRAIATGGCDAAIVGGVDSLCLTTLHGFNSLQLISTDICRPADERRNGISIGEAAGFALLEADEDPGLRLLGYGESSDAYHMSAPDPQGRGAQASMRAALERARLVPAQVDYINLHGTGTQANDAAEDQAVCAVFGPQTPCSSTKGWTGHTLGAAGILEAGLSLLAIEHGLLPQSLNTERRDARLQGNILMAPRAQTVLRVLSNSFGFGGSNCSLLLGAT